MRVCRPFQLAGGDCMLSRSAVPAAITIEIVSTPLEKIAAGRESAGQAQNH